MENKIPEYLVQPFDDQNDLSESSRGGLAFIDRTILNSARAAKSIYSQAENASEEYLLQKINPYIKLISLIYFVFIISIASHLKAQITITLFIFSLYLLARLKIFEVFKKIFLLVFIFGFIVVLPASLNIVTPGKIIFNIITFNKPLHFWIYTIPQNIGFTENGFKVVLLVFLRILNSVSFALLIVFTTSFPSFIKSFKILGVPDTFLMIISLAYKYIFILSRTIEETYFALKSRLSGNIRNSKIRELISGRIFFIFKKSMIIYESTYNAMVSRGYQGKIILHSQKKLSSFDFVALSIIVASGICIIYFFRK
jgi:cobalt/nickel transport system permease protein